MKAPRPDISGVTIVLVGSFNPQIFQPAWFVAQDLIPKKEGESAKIEVVHPEVTSFSIPEWLQLQVTRDRFSASTAQESAFDPVRDLTLGTFQLLRHTPLNKMGINCDFHFKMETEEQWHTVGHRLAPKEPWQGILDRPGMLKLVMQGVRSDSLTGSINVTVEPSKRIHPGVYINVNDHYELQGDDPMASYSMMIRILQELWEMSVGRSHQITQSLVEVARV